MGETSDIRFDERVVIVTGAGAGIGRAHARGFASRGAKVVVNDFAHAPSGRSVGPARELADQIVANGGEAIADNADVADIAAVERMVARAIEEWGRVDVVVNNAGILRDKTFAKLDLADFAKVVDVHLMGTTNVCKAVWPIMRDRGYGRIVVTTSSSGLYGNFGQANYAAAKAAMIGLMNVLHLEGAKYGIKVNAISPTAATKMTEGLLPEAAARLLDPAAITPAVLFLSSESAPSRTILTAGAGAFAAVHILESKGRYLPPRERTPERIASLFEEIADPSDAEALSNAFDQTDKFVRMAQIGEPKRPDDAS